LQSKGERGEREDGVKRERIYLRFVSFPYNALSLNKTVHLPCYSNGLHSQWSPPSSTAGTNSPFN